MIKDDNKIKILFLFILENPLIHKMISTLEEIHKKSKNKYNYPNFINEFLKKNEKAIFEIFKSMLNSKKIGFKKGVFELIDILLEDFKNNKPIKLLNKNINEFWYSLSFEKELINLLYLLKDNLIATIEKNQIFNTFDEMLKDFLISSKENIYSLFSQIFIIFERKFAKDKIKLSKIFLYLLNIDSQYLSHKQWKQMDKFFDKLFVNIKKHNFVNEINNLIYNVITKIKFWNLFDFSDFNILNFLKKIYKILKQKGILKLLLKFKYLKLFIFLIAFKTKTKIKELLKWL